MLANQLTVSMMVGFFSVFSLSLILFTKLNCICHGPHIWINFCLHTSEILLKDLNNYPSHNFRTLFLLFSLFCFSANTSEQLRDKKKSMVIATKSIATPFWFNLIWWRYRYNHLWLNPENACTFAKCMTNARTFGLLSSSCVYLFYLLAWLPSKFHSVKWKFTTKNEKLQDGIESERVR